MRGKGQANSGLFQIQDILYYTSKKNERLLVLNGCCPQEQKFNKYLIHDITKNSDWEGAVFIFCKTETHPSH